MKLEQVQVICPACGHKVKAVVTDGRVKGYCAIARVTVNFLIDEQRNTKTEAEISLGVSAVRPNRDFKGRFVRGNVPANKRNESS